MEDHTPIDNSDPLANDTLLERVVWQGSIWFVYAVFSAMLIVAIIG